MVENAESHWADNCMPVTSDELNEFHRFAVARIAAAGAECLQELLTLWEANRAGSQVHAENVAAVQAAIRDMQNGDRGRPAAAISQELRSELACRQYP